MTPRTPEAPQIVTFTETSSAPYDRHHYKVIFKGGKKVIYCESWEAAYATWFQWAAMKAIDRIEVCDIKKNPSLGFK